MRAFNSIQSSNDLTRKVTMPSVTYWKVAELVYVQSRVTT